MNRQFRVIASIVVLLGGAAATGALAYHWFIGKEVAAVIEHLRLEMLQVLTQAPQ